MEGRRPRPQARPSGPWSAVVGVVFLVVIVIAGLNRLETDEGPSFASAERRGEPVPQFAVPDATARLEGDANVFQDDCRSARVPCPRSDRRRPACRIGSEGAIRACDFFDRPLVISFWFTRGGDCEAQQDVVDRVARRYAGRVRFLSLNIRDDRSDVRRLVRERGWRMTVGHDRDGAVSNLFRVGGCPSFLYALPGGITHDSSIGELDDRELATRVRSLLRATRASATRR